MKLRLPGILTGALALLALSAVNVIAQVGRIEGEVKKQGTTEMIPGATVQIVRTDIKGQYDVTADKKGRFLHAGVPYVGTYTLLISAPGFAPTYLAGIRPTGENLVVELAPGDGHKLTIEEVRAATGGAGKRPGGGAAPAAGAEAPKQMSPADAKKLQEEAAKRAAENEKVKADFEKLKTLFEEGKTLASAKDYAGAVTKFSEAEKLDAEQHVIAANLALALYNRGATQLNAAQGQTDAAKKDELTKAAKQDFVDAGAAASRAITANEPGLNDPAKAAEAKKAKVSYLKIRADSQGVLAKRYFEQPAAEAAFADYALATSLSENPDEKKAFPLKGAQALFDAGVAEKAVSAYQEILKGDPENVEALYGLGLSYVNVGKFQEAANTLQLFADKAPATDSRVADAKTVIKDLIVGNNLTPPKSEPSKGRPAPPKKKP